MRTMTRTHHTTSGLTAVTHHTNGEPTHHCLSGPACRAATTQPDPTTGKTTRTGAPTDKPNTICRRCRSAIRVAVEDLPTDYDDLAAALGDHQRIDGEKVHSTPTPPIPLDVAKDELMGDIANQLANAADRVTRATGHHPPDTRGHNRSARIHAHAHHTANHLDALIASPPQPEEEWCGTGESVLHRDPTTGRIAYKPNTRIVERSGLDTALRLVELRSRARARLAGTTTGLWRLPAHLPGCTECGEVLYTNGHKVVCRACAKDWTEQTAGLLNAEVKRQAELERAQRMRHLETQLADTIAQRDQAWARLDAVTRFLDEAPHILPPGVGLSPEQLDTALRPYLHGHPPPDQRDTISGSGHTPDGNI